MKTYLPLIIGIALILFGGCDNGPSVEPGVKKKISKTVAVDEAYNGKEVSLYKGQELTIQLTANATTGYEWKRVGIRTFSRSDAAVVIPAGEKYIPAGDSKKVGSGGMYEAKFTANSVGKATVTYKYIRPWVGIEKDSKTFTLLINIAE